jgi:predicted MPP superfamily phosphohydrolase
MNLILTLFFASQVYWGWQGFRWLRSRIPNSRTRVIVTSVILTIYAVQFVFNFVRVWRVPSPVHLTPGWAILGAPFLWWVASSVAGALLMAIVAIVRLPIWIARRTSEPESPARREFLQYTAAAPFIAGAYGLLYGRLNLETSERRILLPRLPKAFDGFRIVQLSDIHIGPFMPDSEIRKYVAIANSLKPDLMVLTGDFVTWDGSTQYAAVDALSGVHAPFGVYGCLGNHDAWSKVEDSITELFRTVGVRILRQERVDIATAGESFNLIGIDFQTRRPFGPGGTRVLRRFLDGMEYLVDPNRVNILLSHNPDTFDRAAELGIDLSMAGHTHGGQVALEFISPEIAPSRIVTPYVSGWFQKPGGQLYVNRGIGTIGVPIRVGAPPEITTYVLKRA